MKKFIILLLITFLTFYPFPIYSQSNETSPTPSIETPSPTPSTQEVSSEPSQTPTPEPDIATGDSKVQTDISNNLNLNTVGNNQCQTFINSFEESQEDIDLSEVDNEECPSSASPSLDSSVIPSPQELDILNEATIDTTVKDTANTGQNAAEDTEVLIETGGAKVETNVSNIANTNLIGNNTYYGVINVFEPLNGDIILPYELDFIDKDNLTRSINPSNIHVINDAKVNTVVTPYLNTGDNTATGSATIIRTGDSNLEIRSLDILNTSILDSNFILVRINRPTQWNGRVEGWWGNTTEHDDYTLLWYRNPTSSLYTPSRINLLNNASVATNLQLAANTGLNTAVADDEAEIKTGDAEIEADILNLINTTLIGDNWYHVMINMFENVTGNIVFPRPDLSVSVTSDKDEIKTGEDVTFTVHYVNEGLNWAKDTFITADIPEGTEYVSSNMENEIKNNKIYWNLGKISRGFKDALTFTLRPVKEISKIIGKVSIFTSTDEPDKEDNETSFTFNGILSKQNEAEEREQADRPNQTMKDTTIETIIRNEPIYTTSNSPYFILDSNNVRSEYAYAPLDEESLDNKEVKGTKIQHKQPVQTSNFASLPILLLYGAGLLAFLFKED